MREENRRKTRLILSLLLVLATVAIYNRIGRAPYLNYDDNAYVYENFNVRSGLNWGTVRWAFTTDAESNWHPITWLSHCLDVTLFGLNPAGPHYINVFLHAANAVLLFLLLETATGFTWRSLMVAALFALHPINVESVAWISERKNVLSMFFFLLALAAYGRYVKKPGIARYLLVFVSFAFGLMAKPQVITLPFALLLLDFWPLERVGMAPAQSTWGRLVLEKIPLFALSVTSAIVTMRAQKAAIHLDLSFGVRLENAALSYVKYIGKTIWPTGLAPLYPHPGLTVRSGQAVMAAFCLVAITALVVISGRKYLLAGWLWFLGILVPMIGVVQVGVQAMADRYAYIPAIGLFVMVCWGIAELVEKETLGRIGAAVLAGIALLGLTFATYRYIGYWTDNLALWTHTLEVTQNNFIAEDSMANVLLSLGRVDEAATHFQNAVRINADDPIGTLNLGAYEQQKGNYSAAVERYETVARLTQNPRLLALAFTNLGYANYSQKRYDAARLSFQNALQQQPQNPQAFLGLGVIAQRSGDYRAAVENYENALRLEATDFGYLLLAQALQSEGNSEGAKEARERAERVSRNIDAATAASQKILAP